MSGEPFAPQPGLLHSLLESMDDAVAVVGEDGRFILYNRAAERMARIGAHVTNVTEWAMQAGIPADQQPFARALRGQLVDSEELFLPPAGAAEGVWLSVTARPLPD